MTANKKLEQEIEDVPFRRKALQGFLQQGDQYVGATYCAYARRIRKIPTGDHFRPVCCFSEYLPFLQGKIARVERRSAKQLIIQVPRLRNNRGKYTTMYSSTVGDFLDLGSRRWREAHTTKWPEFSIAIDKEWDIFASASGLLRLDYPGIVENPRYFTNQHPVLELIVPPSLELLVDNRNALMIRHHA